MTIVTLTPPEREQLRHAALEVLAARHPVALPLTGIRRSVAREVGFPFSDPDLTSALEFWITHEASPKLSFETDTAGSTRWYRATAAGLLLVERGL
jgi:hypothetical protein